MILKSKKALFIVNKYSGTGYQSSLEGRIVEACAEHDTECAIEYTQSRGHAVALAQEASKNGYDYVIAVGGDGTLNEVARGLVNTQVPMGIIPGGSGNGLARHLGISIKITEALNSLFDSRIIAIDTFTINDRLSLNVSGIGFDGHIANLFAGKSVRGLFGYIKLTLKEFFRFQEFNAEISMGKIKVDRSAFIIAVANSSQYGNNVKIAPTASVCDGLMHVSIIKKVPPYRFDFIYSFLRGRLAKSDLCEIISANELKIKTSKATPYHIDGEPSGMADAFDICLNPGSLQLLVPNTSLQTDM